MINLLPPSVKQSIKFARFNVIAVQYCVLAILISVIVVVMAFVGKSFLSSTENSLRENIDNNATKIAELESINNEAAALASSIDTIANLLQQEVLFSDLLREIGAVLPPGVVLTGLNLSENKSDPLSFTVAAVQPETIGVLQENLSESELFVGADILSVISNSNISGYNATGELQAIFAVEAPPAPPADETTEEGTADE